MLVAPSTRVIEQWHRYAVSSLMDTTYRMSEQIGDWKNKSLSFAGRLQLCKSVISSMQVYWATLGNGLSTSLWYDMWCSLSPLSRLLTPRDIAREGYSLQASVADLMLNGVWNWPHAWLTKAPNLNSITPPALVHNSQDSIRWCDSNGNLVEFSVKLAREALRPRGDEVL
ncbi:hypothetical protein Tco_1549087 [Tanacetum coccineum]